MALDIAYLVCALSVGVTALGPIPRTVWQREEIPLVTFQEPEVFNYSILLLNEDRDVLYVGARDTIFELDMSDITKKHHQVSWPASEGKQTECTTKGKSKQTECRNYIRVLQELNDRTLFVCGTHAFQPMCDHLSLSNFQFEGKNEEAKGKCPFGPAQSYTSVMVDGELYSGTVFNFLGSEPIITRSTQQGQLRTEYSIPWLNEPSFVFADVVRESENNPDGDDDKIYFFFTEVAVEYEFFGKLLIPRIARVCKGDQGGQRTLQKKWTSFLKARLICSTPELDFVFNILHDVFILKTPNWKDTVFYGIFTSQLNNVGVSAVCAYNMTSVEEVFTKGKFMQSATFEQTQTKWVRSNKEIPIPRPGMCINNEARAQNISNSLQLPDKTLQFIKDHPLMDDPVTPIGNRPRLIKTDVNYTQIAVKRVRALDGNMYDVLFLGTADGVLHKAVTYDTEMHIIEDIQLFSSTVPVQTLLLSSKKGDQCLYASSNTEVVQSPVAFCENYKTCSDCILARDPYCAWNSGGNVCVNIFKAAEQAQRNLMQQLSGDTAACEDFKESPGTYPVQTLKLGEVAKLTCSFKSKLAHVVWKLNQTALKIESPKYYNLSEGLLIFNVSEEDKGIYECFSQEEVKNKVYSQNVAGYVLEIYPVFHHTSTTPLRSTVQSTMQSATQSTMQSTADTTGNTYTTNTPTVELLSSSLATFPTTLAPPTTAVAISTISTTMTSQAVTEFPSSERAEYLKSNDCGVFIFFFVMFFSLFLLQLCYNCYKGFLPTFCLPLRSVIVSKKRSKSELVDCEQGQKEVLMEKASSDILQNQNGDHPKIIRDTGYETETDCGNGKILNKEQPQETDIDKDKPFDVKSNLKYVDSEEEGE